MHKTIKVIKIVITKKMKEFNINEYGLTNAEVYRDLKNKIVVCILKSNNNHINNVMVYKTEDIKKAKEKLLCDLFMLNAEDDEEIWLDE